MNPQNGEVVAMVSWPTFNNNDFIGGISKEKYQEYSNNSNAPLFNRVISGSYPSGSIIKLIIAAAGLEEKIITPNTNIYSSGGLQISKWLFKDWKVGGHGYTNLNKAIAWSVNTYFYMVGGGYDAFKGLGVDNLIKYMKKFGLSEKTGIDLPAENDGFLPSEEWKKITKHEQWYIGDTYNLSIGQGDLLVTPIQAAVWTSAIANGGKKITPHLVSRIIDSQTKQKKELGLNTNSVQIISQENASLVKRAAKECVMNGSCGMLRTLRISSGGKTGTAQWHSTKETHGWFTAFAPYENPQIVVTAIVEEGGEGAYSAMPIVYNFLNWWQNYHLTQ
jgi:penicillin-binding protein 2